MSASDYIDGNDDILSQLSGYTQYGYVATPVSYGASSSPFYSYTIADESSIYDDLGIENPSVTLSHALNKFYKHKAIFVIAPQVSGSDTLMNEASSLRYFILNQTAASTNHSMEDTVVLFDSESSLNSYMTSKNYDNEGYGFGKVGFAVVLYAADVVNQQWEYAIRVNYTSLFDEDDDTVACLYKGCGFTYSIPSTKFKTDDLFKPQNSAYFYGYTYSGFSTVQQIVDQYIFSKYPNSSRGLNSLQSSGDTLYSGIVKIMASVSFMATSTYKTDNFQYVISSTLGVRISSLLYIVTLPSSVFNNTSCSIRSFICSRSCIL